MENKPQIPEGVKNRFKNVYFIVGLIGVLFAAGGITFESLTSWKLFIEAIMSILNNPVAIVSVVMAFIGVFINPTTPGLKD